MQFALDLELEAAKTFSEIWILSLHSLSEQIASTGITVKGVPKKVSTECMKSIG